MEEKKRRPAKQQSAESSAQAQGVETMQTAAALPEAFMVHADVNVNTYPGGADAMFSRPGVVYNTGGAGRMGQYANFTDGQNGFLIQFENGSIHNFYFRANRRPGNSWSDPYLIYHSENLISPVAELEAMTLESATTNDGSNGTFDTTASSYSYRTASFATPQRGFQVRATTNNAGEVMQFRSKPVGLPYSPWRNVYHSGTQPNVFYERTTPPSPGDRGSMNSATDSLTGSTRLISFANEERGLQLEVDTEVTGYPPHDNKTVVNMRVKKSAARGYNDWVELYHTGNFNPEIYATLTYVNAQLAPIKTDIAQLKTDVTTLDGKINTTNGNVTTLGNRVTALESGGGSVSVPFAGRIDIDGGTGGGKIGGFSVGLDSSPGSYCYSVFFANSYEQKYSVTATPETNDPVMVAVGNRSINGFNVRFKSGNALVKCAFSFVVHELK